MRENKQFNFVSLLDLWEEKKGLMENTQKDTKS